MHEDWDGHQENPELSKNVEIREPFELANGLRQAMLAVPIWEKGAPEIRVSAVHHPGDTHSTTRYSDQTTKRLLGVVMPLSEGEFLAVSATAAEIVAFAPSDLTLDSIMQRYDLQRVQTGYTLSKGGSDLLLENVFSGWGIDDRTVRIIAHSHYDDMTELLQESRAYTEAQIRTRNEMASRNNAAAWEAFKDFISPD